MLIDPYTLMSRPIANLPFLWMIQLTNNYCSSFSIFPPVSHIILIIYHLSRFSIQSTELTLYRKYVAENITAN